MIASLYIHVPFCAGACDYCDFYSVAVQPEAPHLEENGTTDPRLDLFVDRLLADAEDLFRAFCLERVPTVYIGGGTPSVLGAARMKKMLEGIRKLLPVSADGRSLPDEFTVEVNPESVDEEFLRVCLGGGVSRISLGVQSFHEPSRRAVHRSGNLSAAQLEERLALTARYYPGAFSVDLIAGLPLQTEDGMQEDIRRLAAFDPAHVSLYALTVESGTPLEQNIRAPRPGIPLPPPADESDAMWLAGAACLADLGFRQYEVSNFAKEGKESQHNTRYWRMENWLGLGPSASGTVIDDKTGTGCRYTVTPDIGAYLKKKAAIREEKIDRVTLMKESLLMGFRYQNGPDTTLFKTRFGVELAHAIPRALEKWRNRKCLATDTIALNPNGLIFLDRFLIDAFEELDSQ